MANIGDPKREITFEPFPEAAPIEEPTHTPVTAPKEPVPA